MRRFFSLLLVGTFVLLSACTNEPTIDGSSPSSAEATISEVRDSLAEEERMAFDRSFELIVRDEIHKNLDDFSGEATENIIIGHVIERVDGKTGREVIEIGENLGGDRSESGDPDRVSLP